MNRPILHLYITQPAHGVIAARGVLETPAGPVEVHCSVPVALLHALVKVEREAIGDDAEVGSLWGSITHAVSSAVHYVSKNVVSQAVKVLRATHLPAMMGQIQRAVASVTGKIPLVKDVVKIFDVAGQALLGKASAKDLLKQLGQAAKTLNPAAALAWATAKVVAKILPKVKPLVEPFLQNFKPAQGIFSAADAVNAAERGDYKTAWTAALQAAPLVPGLGQVAAVYTMADAVRRGQWADLAKGALSLTPQGAMAVQAYDAAQGLAQLAQHPTAEGLYNAAQAARGGGSGLPQLPAYGG